MDTLARLHEITIRLDQIETSAEWLARLLVHIDASASQTGALINQLSEDVREKILQLVTELESHAQELKQELH